MRGMTELIVEEMAFDRAHRLQHRVDAERADQRRQQADAAGKVGAAEGKALVVVVGLLADGGDPQAEEAGEITFECVSPGERAGNDDAEQRDPEELEALGLERHLRARGECRQRTASQTACRATTPGSSTPMARPARPWRARDSRRAWSRRRRACPGC